MFDQEGILYKKIIVKIKAQKNRSRITFNDGTSYKLSNTLVSLFKMRLNSNLINEKAVFITHDNKNIKFITIRDVGAFDATIPPLP
jgi:hypothetical protein